MFNSPQKLFLPDVSSNTRGVTLQVNWNSAVAGSKFIKMKLGNEQVIIRREHLESLMFMIGDQQSQTDFVKSRLNMHNRKKIPIKLFVKTTQNIKKGDTIIINYYKDVPADEQEELKSKGKLIVV